MEAAEPRSTAPVRLERAGDVAVITIDKPPVNALGADVRSGLQACLHEFLADASLQAAVLHCVGRTFSAGADIAEFGRAPQQPLLPELLREIEDAPKPIVAAICGSALGGGLELALACHARIASTGARLGLPEVKLGLLPGAGGTQRLPRLVGLAPAAEMILSGESVTAARAAELGLIDRVTPDGLLATAIAHAHTQADGRPPRRTRDLTVAVAPGQLASIEQSARKRARGANAPLRIVEALRAAVELPFDEGIAVERTAFLEAVADPQSQALRHLFFAERLAGKVVGSATPIERPAVVGGGTMGCGIAIALADAGWQVVVVESNPNALRHARARIDSHYAGLEKKGRLDAATADTRRRSVTTAPELEAVAQADLVIEAIVENLAAKQALVRRLDELVGRDALLATNTSYLDVDAVMRDAREPGRVLGLHFFSPANVMRLVEVVRAQETGADTMATAVAFARRLGKLPVVCNNATGFVGNRMFQAYGRESQLLLLEGASPKQVDAALERFGMAMGPCAVHDLAGIDVGWRARRERTDLPDDPRYFRVADALYEAGRLGQKTARGAYLYVDEAGALRREPDPEVDALIEREASMLGIARRSVSDAEIVERCLLALVNEGARLLEEGVAARASDIDVVWVNGYGFPRWRGGPMHYAEVLGLADVLERLRALEQRLGPRDWRPGPLLERRAATGRFDD